MKTYKNKLAFSLLELSVVILIIGILVAGISQGSRIIYEARLKSARSLTSSSPVHSISNLVLWIETTNADAIATGTTAANEFGNPSNNAFIAKMKNQNHQAYSNVLFNASSDDNRPKYIEESINGLPAIRFDGTNDYLTSDNQIIIYKPTIFVVYKTPSTLEAQTLLYGSPTIVMTIESDGSIGYARHGVPFITSAISPSIVDNKFHILSLVDTYDDEAGSVVMFVDADQKFSSPAASGSDTIAPTTIDIGRSVFPMVGDLSEIIIFSRVLDDIERESVEKYLARKYGIRI